MPSDIIEFVCLFVCSFSPPKSWTLMSWFRGIIAHGVLMVLGWKSFGFDQPFAEKTEKKTQTLLSPILLTTSFFCYLIWYRFYCLLVNVLWHRFKYYYFKSPQFCIGAAASINLGYTASSVICLAIYYSSHENIAKGANSIIWLLRYSCFFLEGGGRGSLSSPFWGPCPVKTEMGVGEWGIVFTWIF